MTFLLEISKYNPDFRDKHGNYTRDDWTGIHDLGSTFSNVRLDLIQYISVENCYVRLVEDLAVARNADRIRITDLEVIDPDAIRDLSLGELTLSEAGEFDFIYLASLIRLNLRSIIYCKIAIGLTTAVFVLDNMYMIIRDDSLPSDAVINATSYGLYARDASARIIDDVFAMPRIP